MAKTREKEFSLRKFKVRKDGGLDVDYSKIEIEAGSPVRRSITDRCSAPMHPDLQRLISGLRTHFAGIHGLVDLKLVKKSFGEMSDKETSSLLTVVEAIAITGVTYVGSDESDRKYVMSAKREVLAGGTVGFSTPMILQDDSRYDCSAQLTNLMQEIMKEVYEYTINRKYAQLSIEFDEVESVGADTDSDTAESKAA